MTLRVILSAAAVAAVGLLCAGCPGAEILAYDVSDQERNELIVRVRVKGLAHVAQYCQVEAYYQGYKGVAGVPMIAGGDEEVVDCRIQNWKQDGSRPAKDGVIDSVFFYRSSRIHEYTAAPPPGFEVEPRTKPEPEPERPRERPTGRTPDRVEVDLTKPENTPPPKRALPAPLSQDPTNPTEVGFVDGRARLTCTVGGSNSPQFALLACAPGKVELRIHVESQSDPETGEPAWWRVELVDANGESFADPQTTFAFVKPGQSFEDTKTWKVDGPVTLKLESVNEAGDVITIELREGL